MADIHLITENTRSPEDQRQDAVINLLGAFHAFDTVLEHVMLRREVRDGWEIYTMEPEQSEALHFFRTQLQIAVERIERLDRQSRSIPPAGFEATQD